MPAGLPAAAQPPVSALPAPALPALQNWVVQQGVLQGADGERAFTLTIKVPVAWAQAQGMLGQALGLPAPAGSPAAGAGLQLPFAGADTATVSIVDGCVLAGQGVVLAVTIAAVERALKREFGW